MLWNLLTTNKVIYFSRKSAMTIRVATRSDGLKSGQVCSKKELKFHFIFFD